MTLTPNSTFGNYQIGEVIGEGGMGQVYRATDTTLDRDVAIKVLPESFAKDADRIARFEREAKTLAGLNHTNIAQIYGLEKQGDTTAIVMELVEGPTLADRIAQGPIPPDEALRIAKQIIDGLEAAHDRGIVHRDLKPANIKVKDNGAVKILDFGIAKPIDFMGSSGGNTPTMVTPAVTEAGVIMGTAAYMSPEQAQGKFVDQRTDIWAFGCVLFEMLTGQPAFTGENVMLTLAKILANDTDMDSIPGTISPSVRHTIELCLEKNPKTRFHHIGDVRMAMEGRFESVHAPTAQAHQAQPLWKRLLPVAAAVVIAVAGTVLYLREPGEARPAAEVRRSMLTLPPSQALNFSGVRSIAVSEDDSRMVYAANGLLYVRNLNELAPRILPGSENEQAITPLFSPDGNWIAYISGFGGIIKRVSVEGGTPLPVTQDYPFGGFNWVDNDTIIYSNFADILRVSANGGESELLFTEETGFVTSSPKILPGGDKVLYQRRNEDGSIAEVAVFSIATGERTILFPGFIPEYHPEGYLLYFENSLGLLARAFDPDTLEVGGPVAMVDDIFRTGGNLGSPQYNISTRGSLLYVQGEVDAAGGNMLGVGDETRVIRQLDVPLSRYAWPSVSPDASQVAVMDDGQIYVYLLDGSSEIRQLTREGNNVTPTWSPDGQYITYSSDRDGIRRIWQQRADGSGVAEALTEGNVDKPQTQPAWAPDGRLAYTAPSGEGEDADIWIVSIPLGEPEVLIGGRGDQFAPDFSPDGQALTYSSSESTNLQVYVAPFPPDGSSTRVSQAGTISIFSVWSRQGGRLYYSFGGNNGAQAAAVDITVPGFAVSNRRELPFQMGPTQRLASIPGSGELLLAVPLAQNAPGDAVQTTTELIFVENWIEEVKARVPPLE